MSDLISLIHWRDVKTDPPPHGSKVLAYTKGSGTQIWGASFILANPRYDGFKWWAEVPEPTDAIKTKYLEAAAKALEFDAEYAAYEGGGYAGDSREIAARIRTALEDK